MLQPDFLGCVAKMSIGIEFQEAHGTAMRSDDEPIATGAAAVYCGHGSAGPSSCVLVAAQQVLPAVIVPGQKAVREALLAREHVGVENKKFLATVSIQVSGCCGNRTFPDVCEEGRSLIHEGSIYPTHERIASTEGAYEKLRPSISVEIGCDAAVVKLCGII
jgi:hypothetical protein